MSALEQLDEIFQDYEHDEIKREVESTDPGTLPLTEDEKLLYRVLRRRGNILAEIERIKTCSAAMIAQLESKLNGIEYVYGPAIESITRHMLAGRKERSIKTAFGVVGFRKVPENIDITDENALKDAIEKGYQPKDMVKLVVSIVKSAVVSHFKKTGEIPPGCEVKAEMDKFYIKQ